MILPALVAATFTWTPVANTTQYRFYYQVWTCHSYAAHCPPPEWKSVAVSKLTYRVEAEPAVKICAIVQTYTPVISAISDEKCVDKFPLPPTQVSIK